MVDSFTKLSYAEDWLYNNILFVWSKKSFSMSRRHEVSRVQWSVGPIGFQKIFGS